MNITRIVLKLTLVLACVVPNFALAIEPDRVLIGLLKQRVTARGPVLTHAPYFKFQSGRVSALNVAEPHEVGVPSAAPKPAETFLVTYDGKTIATIRAGPAFEVLKTNPKDIDARLNRLTARKAKPLLVTTSRGTFSDPEGWRVSSVTPTPTENAEISRQLKDLSSECTTANGDTVHPARAGEFRIEKIYRPRRGTATLFKIRPATCVRWVTIADTSAFERPHVIWLNRSAKGWTRKFGSDLVDVGDYDGRGKAVALFYASDESTVPVGVAELYGLDPFEKIAGTTDQGY